MVVAADDFADNPTSPGRNGTPILFPFPNRIRDGKYTFEGKSYEIPVGTKVHAIHGFAIAANWDVVDHGADGRRGVRRRPVPPGRALARDAPALADRRDPDGPLRPLGPAS